MILFLTPPFVQLNTPYPATPSLVGFLAERGYDCTQRDLSIEVALEVLRLFGDDFTDEAIEILQNRHLSAEEKVETTAYLDELALGIRDSVDPDFGFSRYAEHLCRAVSDFGELERKIRRRGVMDKPLQRHLKAAMDEVKTTVVGVTCPFPGTLVGAFKIAKYVKRHYPGVRLLLGGGYVSTELREMTDRRPYKYFDEFQFDEGYGPLAGTADIPAFVKPSYRGIDWNEYFDVVETDNFVTNLWNSGKWVKLVMARGCYWHKCAFCDVVLPYIGCFQMPNPVDIVDAMEEFAEKSARTCVKNDLPISESGESVKRRRFHFVDEAMPPKVIKGMCEEILKRKLKVEWWGNIRFDAAFTPALCKLMAKAGCIAVTGGLECANDRLLKLMNKGITLAGAEKVLKAFRAAKVFVHAYLMYDFPTETRAEQKGAERYVKDLAKRGLIQSCFWHRFALTVHSPIAKDPEKFGIMVKQNESKFAKNELMYWKKDERVKTRDARRCDG